MEFLKIHDDYYERIKRFILSVVKDSWIADDIVQETFIRINKHIGSLRDSSRLSSWIYRIAWNLCMDYQKKKAEISNQDDLEGLSCGIKIQQRMEQHEMGVCVQEKINRLPDTLRIPMILFDIEGLSHAEIADILDITIDNAKVRLHRARAELKIILENECRFERDDRGVFVCTPFPIS